MHASRKPSVISIFAVSILSQCASSAPQYFEDRGFNPFYQRTEENAMIPKEDGVADNSYETHPDYYNYQGNEFMSDNWFAVNTLPTQDSFWPPEVSESLTPPVYAESKFNSVISEPDNEPTGEDDDITGQFQRGRSDIDPEEDEEEFGGYFYPKPEIPFDLPDFKPVSVATDLQPDVKIITTTGKSEESTEATTTTTTTTTTSTTTTALTDESSTGSNDKV